MDCWCRLLNDAVSTVPLVFVQSEVVKTEWNEFLCGY